MGGVSTRVPDCAAVAVETVSRATEPIVADNKEERLLGETGSTCVSVVHAPFD